MSDPQPPEIQPASPGGPDPLPYPEVEPASTPLESPPAAPTPDDGRPYDTLG